MRQELLELATSAAAAAAGLLVDGWQERSVLATKSSDTDVVTQMDRDSESLLVAAILDARPDDGIIGEEGGSRDGTSGVTWVVDPLDGTVNYLYGFPSWAVSVGVLIDDAPAVGVVHAPALGSVWRGIAGEMAEVDGAAIRTGAVDSLDRAMVATGFGYQPEVRARQGRIVAELLPTVRDIRRAGAAAVDMCWVAQGVVDAYFERGTHIWDRAAAMAICSGAGAVVGGIDGGPATDSMTIASNPRLYDVLRERLIELGC